VVAKAKRRQYTAEYKLRILREVDACHGYGEISVLKRAHGLVRCMNRGLSGFEYWIGWGVIAGSLAVMGRA
jgi:hypothetical protein